MLRVRLRSKILGAWHWLCAKGRLLRKSPMGFYRGMGGRRDWALAKAAYLQEESGKWRALVKTAKAPYSALRGMGFSPQMAIGLLTIGSTAGGAAVVNTTLLSEKSFNRGDHGVYSAPADVPVFYSDTDNTLRVDLADAVGEITIENVTVGQAFAGSTLPAGQTNVVQVGGSPAAVGFTPTFLVVGHLIIDRWRCDTFEMSDVEAFQLNIRYNTSDGQSISPVPSSLPRARGIGGGNRADSMVTSGGTYDQIRIGAPTSAVDGKVDVLRLSNLLTKGGKCLLSRIKAGVIDVEFLEVGLGNGFASKEFVVKSTVVYKNATITANVEESISPP